MKIKSVHLKQFKGFTDLTVVGLPESAKLVILAGPNGVGKSSLFEAFNLYLARTKNTAAFDPTYHVKSVPSAMPEVGEVAQAIPGDWSTLLRNAVVTFHGESFDPFGQVDPKFQKAFYIRTSYRVEPDFEVSGFSRSSDVLLDERRPASLAALDTRVSDNYQRIVGSAVADVFDPLKASVTAGEISNRLVGEARDSLERVLPGLRLQGPGDPLDRGTFLFRKGKSADWRYKNLSGGEKAAFDLMLDFIVKKEKFNDTVFCIDEPESHMNSAVQARLLSELYSKLPESCQLWVATHSAGMMRAAKEIEEKNPGTVIFLDFGGNDFDSPVTLSPSRPDREFWKRQFGVAIGDLAELLAPERLIFCEGSRTGKRNSNFDARCYNVIFATEFPDTQFVSAGGSSEVEQSTALISSILGEFLTAVKVTYLCDRDDRNENEIEDVERRGGKVLARRDIESYLYDDEILRTLCESVGQPAMAKQVIELKAEALAECAGEGKLPDDVKAAAGKIFGKVSALLMLVQRGNAKEGFAIGTLVPLITPETQVYKELRSEIFGS